MLYVRVSYTCTNKGLSLGKGQNLLMCPKVKGHSFSVHFFTEIFSW